MLYENLNLYENHNLKFVDKIKFCISLNINIVSMFKIITEPISYWIHTYVHTIIGCA